MARVILVTGGSRSGKSSFALKLAESVSGRRVFVATCPAVDEEMGRRIARHREARKGAGWETVEETTDLAGVLRDAGHFDVVVVDCLTLWINNLMHEAEQAGGGTLEEDEVAGRCGELLDLCRRRRGTVVLVTNEVGMGVVPDNATARRYRDLLGRCNQVIAAGADAVTLVVSGVTLNLKEVREHESA